MLNPIVAVAMLIDRVLQIYLIILLLRVIISWLPLIMPGFRPRGIVYSIIDGIYKITDPPLRYLRRYVPPLQMGSVSLDLSFVVLYFAITVVRIVIGFVA